MLRKRIIRWMAGVILVVLLVLTGVSDAMYQASLPRVRTRMVEPEIGALLDGYGLWENLHWMPPECVFPGNTEGMVNLYRVWQRAGQFDRIEYYVEAQEVTVLDQREDAILVDGSNLSFYETLVCESDQPLQNGQTVVWLNPDM